MFLEKQMLVREAFLLQISEVILKYGIIKKSLKMWGLAGVHPKVINPQKVNRTFAVYVYF